MTIDDENKTRVLPIVYLSTPRLESVGFPASISDEIVLVDEWFTLL